MAYKDWGFQKFGGITFSDVPATVFLYFGVHVGVPLAIEQM